jgi:hypothetical protein
MFWTAWNKSIISDNIQSGWEKVGLFPWNPESVLQRFRIKDDNQDSSSESSTSILQSKQLRTIHHHLQRTNKKLDNKKAQKVTQTAQHLLAENSLLKSQIQGLEKSLSLEQKRRQRGKPLQFELRAPEDGMAIFYSPNKVQQARDKVAQREEATLKLQEEKNEEKQRKMQEKAEKRRQIEERKSMRATAREIKLAEQAQKRCEREDKRLSRAANRQLQIDIQQREQSKERVIQPIVPEKEEDNSAVSIDEVQESESRVTGRGRKVTLPQRFRE